MQGMPHGAHLAFAGSPAWAFEEFKPHSGNRRGFSGVVVTAARCFLKLALAPQRQSTAGQGMTEDKFYPVHAITPKPSSPLDTGSF